MSYYGIGVIKEDVSANNEYADGEIGLPDSGGQEGGYTPVDPVVVPPGPPDSGIIGVIPNQNNDGRIRVYNEGIYSSVGPCAPPDVLSINGVKTPELAAYLRCVDTQPRTAAPRLSLSATRAARQALVGTAARPVISVPLTAGGKVVTSGPGGSVFSTPMELLPGGQMQPLNISFASINLRTLAVVGGLGVGAYLLYKAVKKK